MDQERIKILENYECENQMTIEEYLGTLDDNSMKNEGKNGKK